MTSCESPDRKTFFFLIGKFSWSRRPKKKQEKKFRANPSPSILSHVCVSSPSAGAGFVDLSVMKTADVPLARRLALVHVSAGSGFLVLHTLSPCCFFFMYTWTTGEGRREKTLKYIFVYSPAHFLLLTDEGGRPGMYIASRVWSSEMEVGGGQDFGAGDQLPHTTDVKLLFPPPYVTRQCRASQASGAHLESEFQG